MKRNASTCSLLSAAVTVGLLIAVPACRTTVVSGPDRCPVEIQTDGTVQVGGKSCRMEDIARRLESMGLPNATMIRVSVPDSVQRETLSRISTVLVSGGYSRFFFVKPLQKEAFVKATDEKSDQKAGKPPSRK